MYDRQKQPIRITSCYGAFCRSHLPILLWSFGGSLGRRSKQHCIILPDCLWIFSVPLWRAWTVDDLGAQGAAGLDAVLGPGLQHVSTWTESRLEIENPWQFNPHKKRNATSCCQWFATELTLQSHMEPATSNSSVPLWLFVPVASPLPSNATASRDNVTATFTSWP